MKGRPTGKTVRAPMSGVKYRVPLTDKGHILGHDMIGDPDPTFLCGRSVWAPQPWYDESEAHARYGDWYLLVDTRDTDSCSPCATKYKAEETKRAYDKEVEAKVLRLESPITQEEWDAHQGPLWDMNDKQFGLTVEWVRGLLGGTIVEE